VTAKPRTFVFDDVPSLVGHALKLRYFNDDEGNVAIPALWREGEGRLCLVVGDNASGKSFFRRVLGSICQESKEKMEYMHLSMEGRRKVAYNPWLAMVYGDEEREATSVNSTETVLGGIRTSEGRTTPHVLFWDEPDLGLSDSWAAGLGQKLAAFARKPPTYLTAAFVVTHNKALVSQLLNTNPHYLHLGVDPERAPRTLTEWFEKPIQPRDPEELHKESRKRSKAIQKILDSRKKSSP
jgi:hypothetical protein